MQTDEKPHLVPVTPDQVDTAKNHRESDIGKPVGLEIGGRLYALGSELVSTQERDGS